ncbi:MAG: arylsulfatase [Porphyromonas sp.]|nr:arylsulfatase [Porphyromonas sp.]
MKKKASILTASALLTGLVAPSMAMEKAPRPLRTKDGKLFNVIYIMADDLGYGDLSFYGQRKFQTPEIDRLAQQGTAFMQAYAGTSVSAPSRASLLTGLHTGHTYVRGNKEISPEGQEPVGDSQTYTLGKLFKSAGYATGIFGKWGLGYPGSDATPNKMGFDEFFGYNCQRMSHLYFPVYLWHNEEKVLYPENENDGRKTFSGHEIHDRALKFIEQHKEDPFYAMLTYTLPHAELNLPHDSIYNSYIGKFPEEKPFVYRGGYAASERPYTSFAAMVAQLDKYVGEVARKVEELGIADRTIIIVTSDNGPHREGGANPDYFNSYGPLRGVKRDLYEGGIRVPFVVYCPGLVPADRKEQTPVAFWDLMPTYAAMVGRTLPAKTDGQNILPLLMGKKQSKLSKRVLYWEFHEDGGKQAVRLGDWKLIRTKIATGTPKLELFNVAKDIKEENDLLEKYPKVAKSLEEIMDREHTESKLFDFGRAYYLRQQEAKKKATN